jgi:hypothetical protein
MKRGLPGHHSRLRSDMELNVVDVERRLEEMQSQLDRLRVTTEENAQSVERRIEALIEHERNTLRELHEQPLKELREHAASLTEVCIATARTAQKGFDRAEARLSSFEHEFHRHLTEIGRDLQSAVSEMRAPAEYKSRRLDRAAPWAFEDVTRLHNQLRDSGAQPPDDGGRTVATNSVSEEQFATWKRRLAFAGLGFALVVAVGFGWYLLNQVQVVAGRAQAAELEAQRAATDATQQAVAAREEAARQISNAREIADRAERIGNVLAAPDLIRYSLSGGTSAPTATGQGLWSRTRGFVFTGTRIPQPPPNGAHQVWLLTRSAPVRASTFVPGPDGTVTLVEEGLRVRGAVVGIMVTAERFKDADSPSGSLVLSTVQPQPPPQLPPQQ